MNDMNNINSGRAEGYIGGYDYVEGNEPNDRPVCLS